MSTGVVVGIFLIALLGGVPTLLAARRVGVVLPVVVGLVAQSSVTLVLWFFASEWSPDATHYDMQGWQIAEFWSGGPPPDAMGPGKEAFPFILSILYSVFGHELALGLVLNVVAHGVLVVLLGALALRLGLPLVRTAWIAALFPTLLLWGGLLLREAITWVLLVAFVYVLAGVVERLTLRRAIALTLITVGLLSFRGTAALLFGCAATVVLLVTASRGTIIRRSGLVAALALVNASRLIALTAGYDTPDERTGKLASLAEADSSFGMAVAPDATFLDALVAYAENGFRVLLGPFPWEWATINPGFVLDGVLWLAVLVLTGIGLKRTRWSRPLLAVLLPAVVLLAALTLTSANYGTMERLRAQSTVLLLPIAAAGMTRRVDPESGDGAVRDGYTVGELNDD